MRVRLTVSISGSEYVFRPGDLADLDDSEAGRLIAAGFAVPVDLPPAEPAPAEAAVSKVAAHREKAVQKKAR